MQRYKVSKNFYADEFLHPEIYLWLMEKGSNPAEYVNPSLVRVCQKVRDLVQSPVKINDWFSHWKKFEGTEQEFIEHCQKNGSIFKDSGHRSMKYPHKAGSRSKHYFGMCADMKFAVNSLEIYKIIFQDKDFLSVLMNCGLTAVENIELTKGKNGRKGWIHVSIQNTQQSNLLIIG